MTHAARIQMKRRMNGKCVDCGHEVHVGCRCDDCRVKVNARFQKRYILTRIKAVVLSGVVTREEILQVISRPAFTSDQQN